jgi:protein SCO1/2
MMFSKGFFFAQILFFAVLFCVGLAYFRLPVQPLPVLGQIADFHLLNSDGKTVSLKDLKGKVWVADFIFTTCGGICPTMTANMAKVHRSYVLVDDVRLVSISVDPENDTPEILKAYAKKFKTNTDRWLFLTGPLADIQKLAVGSFKLGKIDEPVFHSSYFTLVDRQGRIRGYYDGMDKEKLARLFKDIARLLRNQ